jgi:geranylgeranyl pyrophosphate synthase
LICKIISVAVREMSEGELQIEKARDDITEEVYYEIIRKKSTYCCCCALGAQSVIRCGSGRKHAAIELIGMAFQIKEMFIRLY